MVVKTKTVIVKTETMVVKTETVELKTENGLQINWEGNSQPRQPYYSWVQCELCSQIL